MTIWKDMLLIAAMPIGGAAIGAGAALAVRVVVAFRSRRRTRARLLALSGRVEGQPEAGAIWSNGEVWLPGVMMNQRTRKRLDLAHKMGLDVAVDLISNRKAQWYLAGDDELPAGHGWFVVREKDNG